MGILGKVTGEGDHSAMPSSVTGPNICEEASFIAATAPSTGRSRREMIDKACLYSALNGSFPWKELSPRKILPFHNLAARRLRKASRSDKINSRHPLRQRLYFIISHGDASLREAFLSPPGADSSSHGEELGGLGGKQVD